MTVPSPRPPSLLLRLLEVRAAAELGAFVLTYPPGSHFGIGHHPLALYVIADRLAQPERDWKRFERRGFRRFVYPDPEDRARWDPRPREAGRERHGA